MNSTKISYITVSLSREAHAIAEQFAAQQVTPEKGKQVYLNTLAVYAVHRYLNWLQIDTDLSQSDSWHPSLQVLSDTADLLLPGKGRLECRPVLPGETAFRVPPQAVENSIGCVAVQFSESLDAVQLLGFVPSSALSNEPKQLLLANLQPLEALLDCVDGGFIITSSRSPVNLSDWIENTFEMGWQAVERLFSPQHPAFQVRSEFQVGMNAAHTAGSVRRGKRIDLGEDRSVALMVALLPFKVDEAMNIRLQVYPAGRQIYLPPNLHLSVLDETGTIFPELEAIATPEDICLQLEFSGLLGERFTVRLTLGDASITEDFLI